MATTIDTILTDIRRQHGDRADASSIAAAPQFLPYYKTGQRVRVETTYGNETYVRTGTVSRTTGWRPALLLVHRSSDLGSSDLLGARDRVVAVQHGRRYIPVS